MAIRIGDIITPADINNGFRSSVMDVILSGAVDVNSVPKDGVYECVPSNILGNKNTIPAPNVGGSSGTVSAAGIYNNLVYITSILTRVGTYSYIRTYGVNSSTQTRFSQSGKAFYNENYVRQLAAVSNPGVSSGGLITASSINQLFANLLDAWNRTPNKYHHNIVNRTCHSDCYSDCYSDCNCKSSCYK